MTETKMTAENAVFARGVTQFCRDNPEQWQQGEWICGSHACWGGHIVLRRGWQPVYPYDLDGDSAEAAFVTHPLTGDKASVVDAVAMELGIDEAKADDLCAAGNTLDVIDRMIGWWS